MTESYLLRIASAALARGRLAGEVEHVSSGERDRVRDTDELLAFVHRTCPAPPDEPSVPPDPGPPAPPAQHSKGTP